MPNVTNIAAYKFAHLSNLKSLKEQLIGSCKIRNLKGTILLSTEGINLFVAGANAGIESLLGDLRAVPGLESLEPKRSESLGQPFHRMLIKIRKEIISFGVEGIDPVTKPAPRLSARDLKKWLDEGRPVVLLDTRNDYEVQLGTFRNAVTLDIDHFRQFPDAVQRLPAAMKQQPIVMFCTGGIRCEKAGPLMQREGFENVVQLDGGILKYFEECGSEHYDGECFVFDHRVGVDAGLHESNTKQCYVCQSPLTEEQQSDQRYVEAESCPFCFVASEEQRALRLAERHAAICRVTSPLPGSIPYDNIRPLNVSLQCDGQTLLDFLCGILGQIPRDDWRRTCEAGHLRRRIDASLPGRIDRLARADTVAARSDEIVRAGTRYLHVIPGTKEPDVNVDIQIVHEDEAIVVVDKPAPLPMHASGRYCRNTLQYILSQVYEPQNPRPAHRLDANTTGIVVFARTKHFAKRLQQQFGSGQPNAANKRYLARVWGHPVDESFTCSLPISEEAGPLGSRETDPEHGLSARTDFKVIVRYPDGTSLLEVTPHTGRTNQIRVHLWSLDHPIYGDATYLRGRTLGVTQTLDIGDPPLCLHAIRIEFTHPLTLQRISFEAAKPKWAEESIEVNDNQDQSGGIRFS